MLPPNVAHQFNYRVIFFCVIFFVWLLQLFNFPGTGKFSMKMLYILCVFFNSQNRDNCLVSQILIKITLCISYASYISYNVSWKIAFLYILIYFIYKSENCFFFLSSSINISLKYEIYIYCIIKNLIEFSIISHCE